MRSSFQDFKANIASIFPENRSMADRKDLVPSAVLIPFVQRGDEPFLVLTVRTMTVAKHKGQISFPGGAAEPEDNGPVQTALREVREEIGIPKDKIEIMGILDDQITTTGFVITPVVGIITSDAVFCAKPAEVAEIFEVSLKDLEDPAVHSTHTGVHNGIRYRDHRYTVGGRVIWGATGRIVHAFLKDLTLAQREKKSGA